MTNGQVAGLTPIALAISQGSALARKVGLDWRVGNHLSDKPGDISKYVLCSLHRHVRTNDSRGRGLAHSASSSLPDLAP